MIRFNISPIFLLISDLINKLRLHQFLGTKTTKTNKSLKTDANLGYKILIFVQCTVCNVGLPSYNVTSKWVLLNLKLLTYFNTIEIRNPDIGDYQNKHSISIL